MANHEASTSAEGRAQEEAVFEAARLALDADVEHHRVQLRGQLADTAMRHRASEETLAVDLAGGDLLKARLLGDIAAAVDRQRMARLDRPLG